MASKSSWAAGAAIAALLAFAPAASNSVAAPGAGEPDKLSAPETDVAKKKGGLSKKLNSTNGVIHPRGTVDPGIQRPAPPAGAMPVIPPPGSPGGAPNVQPK